MSLIRVHHACQNSHDCSLDKNLNWYRVSSSESQSCPRVQTASVVLAVRVFGGAFKANNERKHVVALSYIHVS